jgi:hypothetical protein
VVTVDIPVGRGRQFGSQMNPILDAVIGGWSLASMFTIQSGQPIPIGMSLPRLADGTQRPNVTCADPGTGISYHHAAATGEPMFNVNCFSDPGDQQLGNAPRYFDNLRQDGIRNVDAALRKEFSIREQVRLQIRFEAFNAFNHTRFGLPVNAWGDSLFGTVNTLAEGFSPRRFQIVARAEF